MAFAVFQQLNLHIPISPLFIGALLLLLLALFIVYTVIIRYHWKSYGVNELEVAQMTITYMTGSITIVAITMIFALLYMFSTVV